MSTTTSSGSGAVISTTGSQTTSGAVTTTTSSNTGGSQSGSAGTMSATSMLPSNSRRSSGNLDFDFGVNGRNFERLMETLENTEKILKDINSRDDVNTEVITNGLKLGIESINSVVYNQQIIINKLSQELIKSHVK